jgi:hypothetical protein
MPTAGERDIAFLNGLIDFFGEAEVSRALHVVILESGIAGRDA